MNILLISINSFSSIPVMRFIINDLKIKHKLYLVECYIIGSYKFDFITTSYIKVFNNNLEFNNQTVFFKVFKFFKVFYEIGSFALQNSKPIIYTQDFEIIAFCTLIKKILFFKKMYIVYHQFEVVNFETNRYKLLKSCKPDLVIFPEVNRLLYFKKFTNGNTSSLIFPNTCSVNTYIEKKLEADTFKKIGDRKVIGHVGNIGSDHFIDILCNLIENSDENEFFFVLIGDYDLKVSKILQIFKNKNNVIMLSYLPHAELSKIYSIIDVGIILYKPLDINYDCCAPNKLYEYWSYGIPVFAHKLKGLNSLFKNKIYGKLFDFYTPNVLFELTNNLRKYERSSYLKNIFSDDNDIKNYLPLLEKAIKTLHEK
jgi:hypothetical protein